MSLTLSASSGPDEPSESSPSLPEEAAVEMSGVRVVGGGPRPGALLAVAALPLFLAAATRLLWPETFSGPGSLVWLVGFVSFSVLTYFQGWRGALAAGALVVSGFAVTEGAAALLRGGVFQWGALGIIAAVAVGLTLSMGVLAEKLHRRRREAFRLAFTDPTSGLPQRRLLTLFLRQQVAAARRGEQLSVVLLGMDGLDTFQERHGEEAAGSLLGRVGDVLLNNTRGADVAGRWAGDRFLAVLPDTVLEGARVFALRAVDKLDGLAVPLSDGSLVHCDVALRIGVATFDASVQDHHDLVRRAERALGAAAAPGGRRVTLFRPREAMAG